MQAAENIVMQAAGNIILAGPDGSCGQVVARNTEELGSHSGGWDVCYRVCAYTGLQTVQRPGVCIAVFGAVHYKKPLKPFDKSRALSRLWAFFCRDIAIIVQKATQSNIHTSDIIHLAVLGLILGLQQLETVTTLTLWQCS